MAEKSQVSTPCLATAVLSPTASSSKTGSNVARIQRNVAEKQRRDKLNGYITELANIVPMVSMSSKRLDKTSILRLSAAHLRICKSPLGGNKKMKKSVKWCPTFLSHEQIREILESVDGFLIVTTPTGKILFTSRSVERYLGHQDIDMIGHSLFMFVHPDDVDAVKDEMERLLLACMDNGSCRCSFRCRLKEKAQPRSEVITYQYVHFVGGMTATEEDATDEKSTKCVVSRMFKAFVKIVDVSPYNQLSLEEATADEYVTRHSLDGTIIFADHRLSTITGHMPHEVIGLSAYEYIYKDDTSIALFAHHLMFSSDKGTGMIVYRLRARNGKLVYLKSVGCLQYDNATSQVDHFVCVNQQLGDSDGELQLKYFVDRYIPHIRGNSETSLFESVKALQVSSSKVPPPRVNGTLHLEKDSSATEDADAATDGNIDTDMLNHREMESGSGTLHKSAVSDQKMLHEEPQSLPTSPDFVSNSGSVSPCSPAVSPDRSTVKEQIFGTTVSDVTATSEAEYFVTNVDDSTSETVEDSYKSNETSSLDGNQSDNVHTSTRIIVSSLIPDNSCSLDDGPSNHIHNPTEMSLVSVEAYPDDNNYGNSSGAGAEGNITLPIDAQFQHLGVLKISHESAKNDGQSLLKLGGLLQNGYEAQSLSSKEVVGNINHYHSQMKDMFNSSQNGIYGTDSSLLEEQFGNHYKNGSVVYEDVDESFVKHSSFISHNNCMDGTNSTLSVINSLDSSVLRNSRWPMDDCFKFQSTIEDTSTSSMDYCDTMPTTVDEVNGDIKDSLSFQEDLSPLLSAALPQSDSNSLPSANGWNDIFSPTEYSSPLDNEVLLQKEEEQLSLNSSKVKSYDLW